MIDNSGVFEDLHQGEVRMDFLCAASTTGTPAHPRYRDPAVLHPGDENTAGVGGVATPGQGAVQQGLQCWQV